jgi:phosphoglycolate phosphatase-like HAD superfamily hydrolase
MENYSPKKDFLVGIDSDGCVFDSMVVKQCVHFHPMIIAHWHLEAIETQLRETAEFVNLYSKWRGSNRFVALLKVFELLAARDDVTATGVRLPSLDTLRAYVTSGLSLGVPSLEQEVARTGDSELVRVLEWSRAVSSDIDRNMTAIPPFDGCVRALELIQRTSDAIVVSQTPEADLVKEWRLHRMDGYVSVIAGQELGTKAEHLEMATGGKYAPKRVLLIGDAPGDRAAAQAVGACFYPIKPGEEVASWEHFHDEAYATFLAGTYEGGYEDRLIAAFEALLPEVPPWEQGTT